MTDDALAAFVELVREITNRAAAAGPLPRGWPYLGIDHLGLTSLDQLASLARHGIFRKYEQVLFLGGGLGAPARWAASHLGCTTIATTPSRRVAVLGRAMTAASGCADAVSHLVGSGVRLPIRDGAVTHVWAIESLSQVGEPFDSIVEAHRVVRPGGYFAAVELASDVESLDVGGRVIPPASAWAAWTGAAGFVDVVCSRIDEVSDQVSTRVAAARTQLSTRLTKGEASLATLGESLRALTSARRAGRVRPVRIVGRRP